MGQPGNRSGLPTSLDHPKVIELSKKYNKTSAQIVLRYIVSIIYFLNLLFILQIGDDNYHSLKCIFKKWIYVEIYPNLFFNYFLNMDKIWIKYGFLNLNNKNIILKFLYQKKLKFKQFWNIYNYIFIYLNIQILKIR